MKEIFTKLIGILSRRIVLPEKDRDFLVELLFLASDRLNSRKFYIELTDNQCLIQESDRYHYVSIRGILLNKNANYRVPLLYKVLAYARRMSWSSRDLSRQIRNDKNLSPLLLTSDCQISLLVKVQTFDHSNSGHLFVITRPLLIVLNSEFEEGITAFEEKNTKYEIEKGSFFLRRLKEISYKKYIFLQGGI